jgi:hypothetical protein
MRDDMFKVIVERPRCVNSNAYKGDGRPFRNKEDGPTRLGMKKGYSDRKWLNENLAPLKRFLGKQVNRPWDKVYSEIRESIDSRSTVKQHILQHLEDFVAIQTRWEEDCRGGRVLVRERRWSGRFVPLEDARQELFVHPLTRILLSNRRYVSWHEHYARKRQVKDQEKFMIRREISDRLQLHFIEGIWHEVTLDVLRPPYELAKENVADSTKEYEFEKRWDVLRKKWVSFEVTHREAPSGSNQECYGRADLYATRKRQLNSKEIQKYHLVTPPEKQKALWGLLFLVMAVMQTWSTVKWRVY